jgi:ribonuclease HII
MLDGRAAMTYLIGTDEAGYGPNLGPLVISATVWQVPDGVRSDDLYDRLRGVVQGSEPGRVGPATSRVQSSGFGVQSRAVSARPVAIADSKKLYQSGKGLGSLERGVLAMLHVLGHRPRAWRMVFDALAPGARDPCPSIPWYDGYDEPVPLDADPADYDRAACALAAGLAAAGVRPVAIRSRVIFEEEFNGLLERHPSKGAALSHETLRLVAGVVEPLGEGPIRVLCDKHGGRNNYRELLEEAFPGCLIEICGEGREQSVYRFGPAERRVEMRFQARAESHLPAALASMVSKYLRELAMRAFNRFWCRHVPGLAPTAGYPLDARRFKTAIAAAQAELGIPDRLLWRNK